MLSEMLKTKIKAWVQREMAGYMRECGSDYRSYMREDGVADFAPDGPDDLKEAVSNYITEVILGER